MIQQVDTRARQDSELLTCSLAQVIKCTYKFAGSTKKRSQLEISISDKVQNNF